jgi:hypothetical protein
MNAFPLLYKDEQGSHKEMSREEQKRRLTRRRSSLLFYRQSHCLEREEDGHVAAADAVVVPNAPLLSESEDEDEDEEGDSQNPAANVNGKVGALNEGLDFICDDDYGVSPGYGDDDDDGEGDDLFAFGSPLTPGKPSLSGRASVTGAGVSSKIQWDSVFTDPLASASATSSSPSTTSARAGAGAGAGGVSVGRESLLPSVDWTQASFGYATLPSARTGGTVGALASQFTSLSLTLPNQQQLQGQGQGQQGYQQMRSSMNSWAGANHWKSKLSPATTTVSVTTGGAPGGKRKKKTEVEEETTGDTGKGSKAKGGKSKSSKVKFHFDFFENSESNDVTVAGSWKKSSKSRVDPRLLSESVLRKQRSRGSNGTRALLLLPEDQKIQVRDLYR